MANPEISPIPNLEPDPLNPNPLTEFNSIDFPPLDIEFLENNDLGFMDDLEFDGDFNICFDDLHFPSDGSDVLSSNAIGEDCESWLLNDDSRVLSETSVDRTSNDGESGNFDVSRVLNCSSSDSRVLNFSSPVLSENSVEVGSFDPDQKVDRCLNDVSRVLNCSSLDSRVLNSSSPVLSENSVDRCFNDVSRVSNCCSSDSGNCNGGGVVEQSTSQDSGGCASVADGFLNSPSPESGIVSESTQSDVVVVDVADMEVKVEEEGKGSVLKRKKEGEDESNNKNNVRSSKMRKSLNLSPSSEGAVPPREDKKKARLMRNRESAQLSRQRKKHYVEELEDKVRSMHTVIADLNGRVSYMMAENASLRQQLCGGNVPPQPGVYPPPGMPPMGYPWIPCATYPMKSQGSQVPLVPIPRLKPRQPVSASKPKKSESKKSESKTKKVSSVTFLGLLFFVFLFWGLVPLVNVRYGGKIEMGSSGFGHTIDGSNVYHQGTVLTVNNHINGSDQNLDVRYSGKSDLRECGASRINCRRVWVEGTKSKVKQDKEGSEPLPSSNEFDHSGNSSKPLAASLYVPRNDELVKIDGNLIIHSILASEKAKAHRATSDVKSDKTVSSTGETPQTSLAIAGSHVDRHPHMYRSSNVRQKALNSGSGDSYKEDSRSTATDGSLQKWFREGLAGPILNSGMCTEVFQFDISSSANPGGIIPATSTVNVTANNASESVHVSKRNRRILNHLPVPLIEFNHTKQGAQNGDFHKNKSVSSMIVSVLVDPKDAGDDMGVDGGISPKSLSRIFVVVLIDSVKYVTYSCMLPFRGPSSHVVTA